MADLIELVFAEDNETLVRKNNGKKVDAIPFGEPESIGGFTYSYFGEECVKESIESEIISQGISKGADAYVRGNTRVREKMWVVTTLSGYYYYWLPIQYYKALVTEE